MRSIFSLVLTIASGLTAAADDTDPLQRSAALLAKGASGYVAARDCFSCHHQALPLLVAEHIRRVNPAAIPDAFRPEWRQEQAKFTRDYFAKREGIAEGKSVPGGPYTAGYALVGLAAAEWPADEVTDALVKYLLATQDAAGCWRIRTHRPPLEDSHFTATALAVRGLRLSARAEAKEGLDERIAKARQWLIDNGGKDAEDRGFRLFGLKWSDAPAETLAAAADELLGKQQADGGWSQLDDRPSDPYATGLTLVALRDAAGVSDQKEAWQRGATWLRQQQLPDGSWKVESRSKPFQKYFESGFPHEKHQFISIAATSWATIALWPAKSPADSKGPP